MSGVGSAANPAQGRYGIIIADLISRTLALRLLETEKCRRPLTSNIGTKGGYVRLRALFSNVLSVVAFSGFGLIMEAGSNLLSDIKGCRNCHGTASTDCDFDQADPHPAEPIECQMGHVENRDSQRRRHRPQPHN